VKVIKVLLFLLFITNLLCAFQSQQIITELETGSQVKYSPTNGLQDIDPSFHVNSKDPRLGILWQTSDVAAIAGDVCVSSTTMNSFVEWYLNNERISLYHDSATPLWEYAVANLDFGYPIDMLEDGSIIAIGDDCTIRMFSPSSPIPTWEHTLSYTINGLKLSPEGDKVYIMYADSDLSTGNVECYTVGNTTPIWSVSFVSFYGGTFGISGDGSTLLYTQYAGGNSHLWVLASSDGSVIFQGPEQNQNPPAISYDASLIVNGDYSGYIHVYEYQESRSTYEEKWYYSVDGGGSSDWIGGMAISKDGSTIAVGTLAFVSGGYDGQLYVFNSYSPTPVWVYDNAGDYVIDVDMTDDGSLIAAATYGPQDHSKPDFFLFRKESNVPVFDINTNGSFFCVDIAGDGSFCTTGGKAVHARLMGSGGLLYSVDCDLGSGFVTGIVNLEGSDDNSGVKVLAQQLPEYYTYTDYNGNFSLDNVPTGVYSIEFSKVGYIAYTMDNVTVIEGETNNLGEITLQSFGSPPLNLTATQGEDIFVELNWDPPTSGTVLNYNIYRKQYELDDYPEESFAVVGSDVLSYTDDAAMPLKEYYYVVTADLAAESESPYSNEVIGWVCSGYVVDEISAYTGTTPTIDGVISAGEWDDAFLLDTSDFWGSYDGSPVPIGSVLGYYKTNTAMTELYVAYINYNDTDLEDQDEVALYIDDNNNGVYSPDTEANEGNYWAVYYASGNLIMFRPIYNTGGVGTNIYIADPQLEVSDATGYVVYEFVIPIGDETWEINPNDDNQSGLAIFVLDENTPYTDDMDGWWPLDNINLFAPDGFGTITYAADIQLPIAPDNVSLTNNEDGTISLTWDQPDMNDFDHFNLYLSLDGGDYELVGETIGTCYVYEIVNSTAIHYFYVTTVNQLGMESSASNIVEYNPYGTDDPSNPLQTKLVSNFPNPFKGQTKIQFSLAKQSKITLSVYNLRGQLVDVLVDGELDPAQSYEITWPVTGSEKQYQNGIYFYKLEVDNYAKIRKMVYLK